MSTINRGTKRQAPTESSNQSETNENLSTDDGMSVPGTATYDEHLSQISGGKRRRKKFTAAERHHVAKVRKAGACKSCRLRKVKVCQPSHGRIFIPTSDANLEIGSAYMPCRGPMPPVPVPFPHRSPLHNLIISTSRQNTLP
jgi:hypothetical protein